MSTLIIGKGLAGLITAIRIKEMRPHHQVLVMEKQFPQGNTYIAGQRIRAGIAHERTKPVEEVVSLLRKRNEGNATEAMEEFACTLIEELERWHKTGIPHSDSPDWFGPQWGNPSLSGVAKAQSVIDWLTKRAVILGIQFIEGEVTDIHREGNVVTKVHAQTISGAISIQAETYVLAGGSSTGLLFESTNRFITNTPQLLANSMGIPLVGGASTMLHPFGMKNKEGQTLTGCFETDVLADHRVFDRDQNRLTIIESMLHEHKAHYHFPEICQQIHTCGGVVTLVDNKCGERFAGISIHYNQLGIHTTDGVSVVGTDNLFAVGDASGVSYWTNGRERYPGIALGNCLVTGAQCAKHIAKHTLQDKMVISVDREVECTSRKAISAEVNHIRHINTTYVIPLSLGLVQDHKKHFADWRASLGPRTHGARQKDINDIISLSHVVVDQYETASLTRNVFITHS